MTDTTAVKRLTSSIASHPIFIFVGIWTFVFFLYALGLSGQLKYDAKDFLYLYVLIIITFLAGYAYVSALMHYLTRGDSTRLWQSRFQHALTIRDREVLWRRTRALFIIWALLSVGEIFASGGLPIVWAFTGNSKNYQDFGIQSLHGFLISVLLACSMISFYLYMETKRGKYFVIPGIGLLWFIVCVTRGYFIDIILQLLCLYLMTRRLPIPQVLKIATGTLCVVIFFGVIGDFRGGGADLIRYVGQPTERFPDWLPTGFLWVYIYLATPLNNLFNTIQLNPSIDNFTLASTTSSLFPTFIRQLIFPQEALAQGSLVDSNLNVSTGLVGPYMDMGLIGIGLFSAMLGSLASLFWSLRRNRYFFLGYTFVAGGLALSVFSDNVLFLPDLFQLFWFWILLRKSRTRSGSLSPQPVSS